jgi:hypothetical protein
MITIGDLLILHKIFRPKGYKLLDLRDNDTTAVYQAKNNNNLIMSAGLIFFKGFKKQFGIIYDDGFADANNYYNEKNELLQLQEHDGFLKLEFQCEKLTTYLKDNPVKTKRSYLKLLFDNRNQASPADIANANLEGGGKSKKSKKSKKSRKNRKSRKLKKLTRRRRSL